MDYFKYKSNTLRVLIILFFLFIGLFITTSISAATFTVDSTADTADHTLNGTCSVGTATGGACTLRAAIAEANNVAGADNIYFNIPTSDLNFNVSSDSWTITIGSSLVMAASQNLEIDGSTQTGSTSIPQYGGKVVVNWTTNIGAITGASGADLKINHITFKSTAAVGTPGFALSGTLRELNIQNSYFTRDAVATVTNTAVAPTTTGNVVFSNNKIDNWRRGFQTTNATSSATILIDSNIVVSPLSIGMRPTGYNISVTNNTLDGSSDQGILVSCTGGNCNINNNTVNSPAAGFASIVASGAGTFNIDGNNINSQNNSAIYFSSAGSITNNTIEGGSGNFSAGKITVVTNDVSKLVLVQGNTVNVTNAIPIWIGSTNTRAKVIQNAVVSTSGHAVLNLSGGTENSSLITSNDEGDSDSGVNNLMNAPIIQKVTYLSGGKYKIEGVLNNSVVGESPMDIEICISSNTLNAQGDCHKSLGYFENVAQASNGINNWSVEVDLEGSYQTQDSILSALATNNLGTTSEFSENFHIDNNGNYSTQSFEISLVSPAFNQQLNDNTPLLDWADSGDLDLKHYEIYLNGKFYALVLKTQNYLQVPAGLPAGEYTWQVIGVRNDNTISGKSISRTFRILGETTVSYPVVPPVSEKPDPTKPVSFPDSQNNDDPQEASGNLIDSSNLSPVLICAGLLIVLGVGFLVFKFLRKRGEDQY